MFKQWATAIADDNRRVDRKHRQNAEGEETLKARNPEADARKYFRNRAKTEQTGKQENALVLWWEHPTGSSFDYRIRHLLQYLRYQSL